MLRAKICIDKTRIVRYTNDRPFWMFFSRVALFSFCKVKKRLLPPLTIELGETLCERPFDYEEWRAPRPSGKTLGRWGPAPPEPGRSGARPRHATPHPCLHQGDQGDAAVLCGDTPRWYDRLGGPRPLVGRPFVGLVGPSQSAPVLLTASQRRGARDKKKAAFSKAVFCFFCLPSKHKDDTILK